MVALVGDRDDLIAQIERKQQFRGMGNEAYNAHSVTVMPVPSRIATERALSPQGPLEDGIAWRAYSYPDDTG